MARNVKFKGGKELNKLLKTALKGGKQSVEVGFFEDAAYDDGTPVAHVAAIQEFGYAEGGIPERPFFRMANKLVKAKLLRMLKFSIDPKNMIITSTIADRSGILFQGEVQKSITDMTSPANKAATIEKKGSSSPLIDSGKMRQSVTYKVK